MPLVSLVASGIAKKKEKTVRYDVANSTPLCLISTNLQPSPSCTGMPAHRWTSKVISALLWPVPRPGDGWPERRSPPVPRGMSVINVSRLKPFHESRTRTIMGSKFFSPRPSPSLQTKTCFAFFNIVRVLRGKKNKQLRAEFLLEAFSDGCMHEYEDLSEEDDTFVEDIESRRIYSPNIFIEPSGSRVFSGTWLLSCRHCSYFCWRNE